MQELANGIEVAVRPDAAGVFLCKMGNMLDATCAVAPAHELKLGRQLIDVFLSRIHRAGLNTPWYMLGASADAAERDVVRSFLDELLDRTGFEDLIGGFLRSQDGMIAGWITIFSRSATPQHRAAIDAPLGVVCRAAEETLRTSLGIAAAVGARFPKISPSPLSDRERAVAALASNGFSDLNIAKRLRITEGTVGRHLHNIYRKLGVSSRLELIDALGVTD
jgi:DNA-binding CsgD family transcriptional regulator